VAPARGEIRPHGALLPVCGKNAPSVGRPGGERHRLAPLSRYAPLKRHPAAGEDHFGHSALEADRARDARLTSLGYQVVRFMHRQVTTKPEAVAATLRALLAPRPRRVRA